MDAALEKSLCIFIGEMDEEQIGRLVMDPTIVAGQTLLEHICHCAEPSCARAFATWDRIEMDWIAKEEANLSDNERLQIELDTKELLNTLRSKGFID